MSLEFLARFFLKPNDTLGTFGFFDGCAVKPPGCHAPISSVSKTGRGTLVFFGRRCQILQPQITHFCGLNKPFPVIVGLLHWVYTRFACLYLASDESFQSFQNLPGLVEGSRFKRVILSFYPRLGKDLSWR